MHTKPIGRFYSVHELKELCQLLELDFRGAVLQDVLMNAQFVLLNFWLNGPLYVMFCLDPAKPWPVIGLGRMSLKSTFTKPLSLFLKAHIKGKALKSVELKEKFGRVMLLTFEGETGDIATIEARLIPKQFNLIIQAVSQKKSISLEKPLMLSEQINQGEAPYEKNLNYYFLSQQILATYLSKENRPQLKDDPQIQINKIISKKQKALTELEAQVLKNEEAIFFEIGEKLKSFNVKQLESFYLEASVDLKKILDPLKSVSWNMTQCFEKAKKIQNKKNGTLERIEILKSEIAKLNAGESLASRKISSISKVMSRAEVKGRQFVLEDGVEVFYGKSAEDNLKLLRKAQAWDLWIHLKDYPSTHAIVRKPKNKEISLVQLQRAAEWVLKEKPIKALIPGSRVELIYVECRFVRPIKGDKTGRVTHHNAKHFFVNIPA